MAKENEIGFMKIQSILGMIARFSRVVILVECVILILVGFIGWRTFNEFGDGLQIAGILAIGISLLGIKGNWDATRSFEYQYSLSSIKQSSLERTQQTLLDFAQSYAFLLVMLTAGGLSILIGWLI